MNQDWHFRVRGELEYQGEIVYLHPENFVNLIRVSRYNDRMFPIILARLQIDKRLFDHIIKNADNIEIHLTITKFVMDTSDRSNISPEETHVDDMFQVVVGSDINYNKELDYIEEEMKNIRLEDKFKETYIGLISKKCLDANKIVVNDVILNSMMQDVIISYFDQKDVHLLMEPLHNNEPIKQLSLPPIDTMYTLLEHLNGMKVFYNTKYMFFIDEPYCTYLISKNGQGIPSVLEKYNDVIIRMHSSTDSENMTIGMNNDGETEAYIVDVSVHNSNYQIDNDTVKVINAINAVINPNIDHTKIAEDTFKALKDVAKRELTNFLTGVLQRALAQPNIGALIGSCTMQMDEAVGTIRGVTKKLQGAIREGIDKMIQSIPTTIGVDMGDYTLDVPFLSDAAKSIMKSFTDGKFISQAFNADIQEEITNCFGASLFDSCSQAYKEDFADNFASAVSYVHAKDISKATTDLISNISKSVPDFLDSMMKDVTNRMHCFPDGSNDIGNIIGQMKKVREILEAAAAIGGASGAGAGSVLDSTSAGILDETREFERVLTILKGITDDYNQVADHAHEIGNYANDRIKDFSSILDNISGCFGPINQGDIKDRLLSNEPPRIFGDLNPAIFQTGGCFGGGNSTEGGTSVGGNILQALCNINIGNSDLMGVISNVAGGIVKFEDISKLKTSLENFDLKNLGDLGLSSFSFDLNVGTNIPGLPNKINIGPTGVKILKVKNDNPNELKNIKAEMEMSKNTLSISKTGMDPSVFTPNKKYTISNYDGHNNKDGRFFLISKVEVFTREDTTFLGTTELTFSKLPEETKKTVNSDSTKAQSLSAPDPQVSQTTDDNKPVKTVN